MRYFRYYGSYYRKKRLNGLGETYDSRFERKTNDDKCTGKGKSYLGDCRQARGRVQAARIRKSYSSYVRDKTLFGFFTRNAASGMG